MKKRLLSLLLTVCLIAVLFSGLTMQAAAVEPTTDTVVGYLSSYVIKTGDTMIAVCADHGIDFLKNQAYIARLNSLVNYSYILPGKQLWLPVTTLSAPAPAHYTLLSHTLATGESLLGLCQSYGIDYTASAQLLAALNSNLGSLLVGQNVILPVYVAAAGATPTPTPVAVTATPAPGAATIAPSGGGFVGVPGDQVSYYLVRHVLKAGETVSGLCAAYGIDFNAKTEQIMKLNNITSYYYMFAGKELLLPVTKLPTGEAYYRIMAHTIVAGDTVWALCLAYGIDLTANTTFLQRLNNRKDLTTFLPGQTLYLPASGAIVPAPVTTPVVTLAPGATATPYALPTMAPSPTPVANPGTVVGAPATIAPTTPVPGATAVPVLGSDTVSYYLLKHVLQAGETVTGICAAYGIDFDAKSAQIMKINNIASYNYLIAGQSLWLPVTTLPSAAPYYRVMAHTIVAGDAVYNLCGAYGIDFTANTALLQRLNNRTDLTTFYTGQIIYLPVYIAA